MTPKEKAELLIVKYRMYVDSTLYDANEQEWVHSDKEELEQSKKCSLIAVDEMIEQNGELYLLGLAKEWYKKKNAYLFDVKQEIEKL